MANDSKDSEIAPLLMLAARTHLAATIARVTARGFEGLTPAFASAMPLLDGTGMRVTLLAQRAGVTKQAMSQLVKLLQQRGYVEQIRDKTDTRAKVVRLTKRGVALREACAQVRQELQVEAGEALGKRNLLKLQQDLKKLTASMTHSLKSEGI